MPLAISAGLPSILIRKEAFERAELTRGELDSRFNLTEAEFRVEGDMIALGPLPADDMVGQVLEFLEGEGLAYFDDVFELSGNWPEWVRLYAR